MTFRHKAISAGLAATLVLSSAFSYVPATVASADPASELEAAAVRLEELGSALAESQESLEATTAELEAADYELASKQAEVESTQAELDAKQTSLSSTMRNSYKSGSTSSLDLIFGSGTVEELVSRIYYLIKLSDSEAAAIEEVRSLGEELAQEQQELEAKQAELQERANALNAEVESYSAQLSEATAYYNELDEQVKAELAAKQEAEENAALEAALNAAQTQAQVEASQEAQEQQASNAAGSEQTESDAQEQTPAQSGEEETDAGAGGEKTEGTEETKPTTSETSGSSAAGGGVATALAQVGKAYVYRATGPDAFDCSGLVCYSYGYALGRSTYAMIDSLKASGKWKTSMDELSYGDLCFTSSGGHVGIYLGNGQMVHAANSGTGVIVGAVYGFVGGGSYY